MPPNAPSPAATGTEPVLLDAAHLRRLGADRLADLLRRRPEAAADPPPASLAELAERLADTQAVLGAMRRLDLPPLQVAEALAAVGGETSRAYLYRLLGVPGVPGGAGGAGTDEVDRAAGVLADHGLLLGDDHLYLVEPARHAWPRPLDLGMPVTNDLEHYPAEELLAMARGLGVEAPPTRKAELAAAVRALLRDPERVRAVVDGAPPATRELLLRSALQGERVDAPAAVPGYPGRPRDRDPAWWALERGLLVPVFDGEGLEVPAEVGVALRGTDGAAPFVPVPPVPPTVPVAADAVEGDAAACGGRTLRLVAALLDEAGRTPVATRRTGGVGVRELRRLARTLGHPTGEVRLALALAHRCDLLAFGADGGLPTARYDGWLRAVPGERLADLQRAWWSLPYAPTADPEAAWLPSGGADGAARLRRSVLEELAGFTGRGVTDPGVLAAAVLWRCPYQYRGPAPDVYALACWHEAALLGATGAGALSPAGRALLAADDAALATALPALGDVQRSVVLQADLTAVVAGTPDAELAALLDLAADRESSGAATTWRFGPASVRRALDAGLDATGLLSDLAAAAVGGVPQPLEYLVGDVGRRHGAVRGREVACCLRSDDPALVAEIAADRRLRRLGLRAVAPTVLVGQAPLADTLAALRGAGYAPVAETADGAPVVELSDGRRHATPAAAAQVGRRLVPARPEQPPQPSDVDGLVRDLLARPDTAEPVASATLRSVRAGAPHLSVSEARVLAHAVDTGGPVTIDYVNQDGRPSHRVIEDVVLSGQMLYAWCRLRNDDRVFTLWRVQAVSAHTGT